MLEFGHRIDVLDLLRSTLQLSDLNHTITAPGRFVANTHRSGFIAARCQNSRGLSGDRASSWTESFRNRPAATTAVKVVSASGLQTSAVASSGAYPLSIGNHGANQIASPKGAGGLSVGAGASARTAGLSALRRRGG